MKLRTILDQIDLGRIALPEFQRGFVWNRDQVRGLMDSLYRSHPVGALLVWITGADDVDTRGSSVASSGTVELLLDGQQRITALYGIMNGKPPIFFEGDSKAFTDLYFNMDTERFEFYATLRMRDNPLWISVTELMIKGAGQFNRHIYMNDELEENADLYTHRLNTLSNIKETDFYIEQITGEEKDLDVVVDIFNRVNSGGTKLSKGDLALAKVCASWPEARQELRQRLSKWKDVGFNFKLDWLLRCVNTQVTGEALFTALEKVDTAQIRDGLEKVERSIDRTLDLLASRLGLDHDRVLKSKYAFPLIVRYLDKNPGAISDHTETGKLLFWYIHTFLWGRYSGSTESILNQDLELIEGTEKGIDRLIEALRSNRGDLSLTGADFQGWSVAARFYPMLYLLSRVYHSRDWHSGVELKDQLLGRLSNLQLHHIFPKALLYRNDYEMSEVNALANFTFLTQETNLAISDRDPVEYFEEIETRHPGALESHWIPMDKELWKTENYLDFLEARRLLLSDAANKFMNSLLTDLTSMTEISVMSGVSDMELVGGIVSSEEEQILLDINLWIVEMGLPEGEFSYELVNERSDELIAVLDLAWPDGIQEQLSQPAALLVDEDPRLRQRVSEYGYRIFDDPNQFKEYVESEILGLALVAD